MTNTRLARRIVRLNSLLKEVISDVVFREVKNPKVNSLITITNVDVARDLHTAKVSFSVIGSDKEKTDTLHALNTAAGFISTQASKQVRIRFFPVLTFTLDNAMDQLMRIDELIDSLSRS